VAELHELYCQRLTELFYAHRAAYGYADVELRVV